MEHTASGALNLSGNVYETLHNNTLRPCSDDEAASRVRHHIRRNPPHGKHERILRRLIESREPLDRSDVKALDSTLTAADVLFFDGQLKGRVRWEWSHPEQPRYRNELIGTTALKWCAQQGGFETLIVLSDPILNHPDYDRRLLLSVFLHELIHCYLFILRGFDAKIKGGHTTGFHDIAEIVDNWVGSGYLRLCNMKANLNYFRNNPTLSTSPRYIRHSHEGCNQSPRSYGDKLEEMILIKSASFDPKLESLARHAQYAHEGCNQGPRPPGLEDIVVIRSAETGPYF